MAFDVKSEILSQIDKTDDKTTRTVLLLMLGVLEQSVACVEQIGEKIDALRADEESLKRAVLNGHEASHHSHHDWIAEKIQQETEAAKNNRSTLRKLIDTALTQAVTILVTAAATAMSVIWMAR